MMKTFLTLASLSVALALDVEVVEYHFKAFIEKYQKTYPNKEERLRRMKIFADNLKKIIDENSDGDQVFYKITQFTDQTDEEFQQSLAFNHPYFGSAQDQDDFERDDHDYVFHGAGVDYPLSFSWTGKCDSGVHNQGPCGSCWAFATVAALESSWCVKTGELLTLSPQMLVDCDNNQAGCGGASTLSEPIEFVAGEKGLCRESDYGYKAANGECKSSECEKFAPVKGLIDVSKMGVDALARLIHTNGSVSIGIDATKLALHSKGVITREKCNTTRLNHAVTVVGFEVDPASKTGHFLVKNSWGPEWGEEGHFRVEYGACVFGLVAHGVEVNDEAMAEIRI